MRAIDADALIKWLDNYYDSEKFTVGHICNMVKDMPTIEERKRGTWLPDGQFGFWVCSSCKFPSEASAANLLYKYCPVCGADMREGQE